jgi:hypothetical protein
MREKVKDWSRKKKEALIKQDQKHLIYYNEKELTGHFELVEKWPNRIFLSVLDRFELTANV